MGQKKKNGTERYRWIPPYFVDERIGYVLGDALDSDRKVVSLIWLKRGNESEIE